MKIRILAVSILGVLVVSGISLVQETAAMEPASMQSDMSGPQEPESSFEAQEPTRSSEYVRQVAARPAIKRPTISRTPQIVRPEIRTEVRIFKLQYIMAEEVAKVIMNILRIQAHPDKRSHSLIVSATKEEMASIASLIEAMDVAIPEDSTVGDIEDLVYRVYMFEIASGNRDMKPFSMILQVSPEVETSHLLDADGSDELQISGFSLSVQPDSGGKAEIRIQGKAASNAALKRLVVDNTPESRIKELAWDDAETFTDKISAAQFGLLPEQMQKHIARLLGDEIRTVGYWFGNLSVPGSVEAPIGPWILNLRLNTESDRMLELFVDVRLPSAVGNDILSNTLRAKIGKPIIIGYNRESYGTRKMGAMVIVPEADSL